MEKASASPLKSSRFLRRGGVVLLVSGLLAPNATAQAETGTSTDSQTSSVVFQDPNGDRRTNDGTASTSPNAATQLQLGIGGSLVYQAPRGDYQSDHGNERAWGFSLQVPIRRSKEWTFLPTITKISSSPGPSKSAIGLTLATQTISLDHETKSFGLDVHWRGWDPGAVYLLLGGGMAKAKLEQTRTQCAFLIVGCTDSTTPIGSKTAPYVQAGFGFESVNGGPFIETRMWRGPYIQPIALANGTLVGSQGKTGNALFIAVGGRFHAPPF
jgi:hypothetical protein